MGRASARPLLIPFFYSEDKMNDLELFKAIVRMTKGVPHSDVGRVVGDIRQLFVQQAEVSKQQVQMKMESRARIEKSAPNRMEKSGFDRSEKGE